MKNNVQRGIMASLSTAADWLLRALDAFLGEDDAYALYLFAIEQELPALRDYLKLRSRFALLRPKRLLHSAMVFGCWTALCRLLKVDHNAPVGRYRLPVRTGDTILINLRQDVALRPTPDRRLAMLTAASPGSVPDFVMYVAAERGYLESVVWLHHVCKYDRIKALEAAVKHRQEPAVEWLLDHGRELPHHSHSDTRIMDIVRFAVDRSRRAIMWTEQGANGTLSCKMFSKAWGFVTTIGRTRDFPLADLPARHGDLEAVQLILAHDDFAKAYSTKATDNAASGGHLHILEWLHEHHIDAFQGSSALHMALVNGHIHVAQWLRRHDLGGSLHPVVSLLKDVASNGHLPALQWIVSTFPKLGRTGFIVCYILPAARNGQLQVVQWLIDVMQYPVTILLVKSAAESGRLDLTRWLLTRCSDDVDLSVVMMAAKSGNRALVQWFVETYGLWDPILFSYALRSGNIDTIEYLYALSVEKAHEHGVCVNDLLRIPQENWILKRQYESVAWLLEHGLCEEIMNQRTSERIVDLDRLYTKKLDSIGWTTIQAFSADDMDKLWRIISVAVRVGDRMFMNKIPWLPAWAVRQRSLPLLQHLLEIHHPSLLSPKVFRIALQETTDEPIVKWFLQHKPTLFSPRVIKWAMKCEHSRLLCWIHDDLRPTNADKVATSDLCEGKVSA